MAVNAVHVLTYKPSTVCASVELSFVGLVVLKTFSQHSSWDHEVSVAIPWPVLFENRELFC